MTDTTDTQSVTEEMRASVRSLVINASNPRLSTIEAMQMTQAALNGAHAMQVLYEINQLHKV